MKPTILKPINPEQQLTETLGMARTSDKKVSKRAAFLADNISRVVKINGSRVFCPEVDINTNEIFYQLSQIGDECYYPIRFALIELAPKI